MDSTILPNVSLWDCIREGYTMRTAMAICKEELRIALGLEMRAKYSNPRYSAAVDPDGSKEVGDAIAIATEDAHYSGKPGNKPVLLIHVTDVAFVIANLPAEVRDYARKRASERTSTRYHPSGDRTQTKYMWLQELIDHGIIGFPTYSHRELVAIIDGGHDGLRVPCPYNKITGQLTFCLAQVRFTTIYPPFRYTYAEANKIIAR